MPPWAGYIRVSRVGEREERLVSPELQADRIRSFAAARSLEVEMLEPELDVSGGKVDRPILGEAIAGVESGRYAGIIVAQLDRLSRMSLVDALHTIRRIEDAGGEVLAAGESFDTSTPEGRMGRNVFLSMAEMQLVRYRDQFAAAKVRAVEAGIWPFPVVPIGYRKGDDRRLALDPSTAPTVRRAFELRGTGSPWSVVGKLLGKGQSGAAKVIANRVYLGEIGIDALGVRNSSAHEPLVDRGLWEAAQMNHPRPARGTAGPSLLAGIIRCAECARTMTPAMEKGRRRYRCFAQRASGRCPRPALIAASLVEPLVEQTFLAHVDAIARSSPRTDQVATAERRLMVAENELESFQRAVSASELGAEKFGAGLRKRAEAVDAAGAELGRARSAVGAGTEIRRLSQQWPSLSVEQRRHVLRSSLGAVWVRKGRGPAVDRVRITAAGFEPADLSRPGVRSGVRRVDWADLPGEIPLVTG